MAISLSDDACNVCIRCINRRCKPLREMVSAHMVHVHMAFALRNFFCGGAAKLLRWIFRLAPVDGAHISCSSSDDLNHVFAIPAAEHSLDGGCNQMAGISNPISALWAQWKSLMLEVPHEFNQDHIAAGLRNGMLLATCVQPLLCIACRWMLLTWLLCALVQPAIFMPVTTSDNYLYEHSARHLLVLYQENLAYTYPLYTEIYLSVTADSPLQHCYSCVPMDE